jgi:transcriptional regulator with PAS, ATPase and Fis domain
MNSLSIVVVSGENALEHLGRVIRTEDQGKSVDLIVLVCRDAKFAHSQVPPVFHRTPILTLASSDFSYGALAGIEALFINSPLGRVRQLPSRRTERRQVDDVCDLIDGQRIIGESPPIEEVKRSIQRVAATDANVLITGETGTGKELIAELIQKNSKRRHTHYVCINCAAIPDSLLESELFGYERGAFTGAQFGAAGKLEGAHGGTVFFDEIGDMSLHAQAKILRLIETKEIQRLGAKRPTRVDFRVIAATNRDIDSPLDSAHFRRDLYFRLNVARIHLPALRERKSDIPLLIRHFIQHFNRELGRSIERVGEAALRDLLQYGWPGNIRELRNVVEGLFVNLPPGRVTQLELPEWMRQQVAGTAGLTLNEQERLISTLWATDWNKSKAARTLHWSRMTLYRKMAKYGLEEGREKKPPQSARPEEQRRAGTAGAR